MDDVWAILVGCAEHGEQWGNGEIEGVVAGHLHSEHGVEVDKIVDCWHFDAGRGEDAEITVCVVCGLRDVLDEATDAVDVGDGVGELEYACVVCGHVGR